MNKKILEQISKISVELRLPAFRSNLQTVFLEAATEKTSPEQLVLSLLESELKLRLINRKKIQMRNAGFPQLKYLYDLQRDELPEDGQQKLPLLETLEFIDEGRNVILGGSPGTGNAKHYIM